MSKHWEVFQISLPSQNVLNLTQNGCDILGTNTWDNGAMTGSDQIVSGKTA